VGDCISKGRRSPLHPIETGPPGSLIGRRAARKGARQRPGRSPDCRDIMNGQRRFPASPMPPGRPGVERSADDPGPGGWMMADLVPGRAGPGERLGGLVLGQRHVAVLAATTRRQDSQLAAKNSANSANSASSRLTPINPTSARNAYLEPEQSGRNFDLSVARWQCRSRSWPWLVAPPRCAVRYSGIPSPPVSICGMKIARGSRVAVNRSGSPPLNICEWVRSEASPSLRTDSPLADGSVTRPTPGDLDRSEGG